MQKRNNHTGIPTPTEYKSWYEWHAIKPRAIDLKNIHIPYYWNADPDKCSWIFTPEEYSDLYSELKEQPNLPPVYSKPKNYPSDQIKIYLPGGMFCDSKFFPDQSTKDTNIKTVTNDIDTTYLSEEIAPLPFHTVAIFTTVVLTGVMGIYYYFDTDYDG